MSPIPIQVLTTSISFPNVLDRVPEDSWKRKLIGKDFQENIVGVVGSGKERVQTRVWYQTKSQGGTQSYR